PSLAILGGTFDPPHLGHLVVAETAREQLRVDQVLWLPAGDPWRKSSPSSPLPSPSHHRLAMVRLAIADNPAFAVDDREVRREGPTYTAETLEAMAAEGIQRPYLLLGADALADLPNWHRPDAIRDLARIVIAPRPGDNLAGVDY